MPMGPAEMAGTGISVVTVVLLLVLTVVWLKNYRRFRSGLVLGLVAFGAVLLVENVVAVYFFFSMHTLYANEPLVGQVVLGMRSLQLLAVGFLTYVTLQ